MKKELTNKEVLKKIIHAQFDEIHSLTTLYKDLSDNMCDYEQLLPLSSLISQKYDSVSLNLAKFNAL